MKGDSALRSILRDLTIALSEDNKFRDVQFTDDNEKFGYAPNEETVFINPKHAEMLGIEDKISDKQEFLLIVDTQSHEHEHQTSSDLNSISEFAKQYPGRPKMAAMVMNAVEDTYIDNRRLARDRGLKPVCKKANEYWIKSQKPISEYEGVRKYMWAVFQITRGNGTPKQFDKVKDEVFRDYCAKVRILIDRTKDTHIPSDRQKIGHKIMSLIEDEIGEAEVPEDMELPENMPNINNEKLPESNQENVVEIPMPSSAGKQDDDEEKDSKCPKCGFEDYTESIREVDGMEAARILSPFDKDDEWIDSCEFIMDSDENGLCGFRVKPNGDIPKNEIMNQGYLIDEVSSGIEILEPKYNYDDTENITECNCPKCNHEWIEQ